MSHFTKIKTQLREWEILKQAITNMGFIWEEKEQELISDAGEKMKVSRVIVTGKRDSGRVGIVTNEQGEFEFCADWFEVRRNCNLDQQVFLRRLRQHYSRCLVLREAQKAGLIVEEERCENGEIRIVLSEPI